MLRGPQIFDTCWDGGLACWAECCSDAGASEGCSDAVLAVATEDGRLPSTDDSSGMAGCSERTSSPTLKNAGGSASIPERPLQSCLSVILPGRPQRNRERDCVTQKGSNRHSRLALYLGMSKEFPLLPAMAAVAESIAAAAIAVATPDAGGAANCWCPRPDRRGASAGSRFATGGKAGTVNDALRSMSSMKAAAYKHHAS